MKRSVWLAAIAMVLAVTTAASAEQFDPQVYARMVDASSAETIAPGTKITLQNWTQYKNFFPYFIQLAYQGRNHFHIINNPDYAVVVGPTEVYPQPKAMREDTEKYAGQTKLVPDPATGGFTWTGYQAGVPFPRPAEPNQAAKVIYNTWAGLYMTFVMREWSHNWLTDSFGNVQPEDTDDCFYRPTHLSDPPYPMNQPDAAGSLSVGRFIEIIPEQAKYTTALEIVTDDPSRMTEEYVFLPSLRRSLRLSSASRCAPILGTDFLADDSDWKPAFFKPELIGEKKILMPFTGQKAAYTKDALNGYVGGDDSPGGAFPGWPKIRYNKWQLRDMYLINMKPTGALGRGYCYGQRIFYVDAETWRLPYMENYDRNGKLYHIQWVAVGPVMYQGQKTILPRTWTLSMAMDWENNHATPSMGYDLTVDQNTPAQYREPGVYTPSGLDRVMK